MAESAPPAWNAALERLRAELSDRFEFLHLLGQGGGGAVFKVRNLHLQREEALKVLTSGLDLDGDTSRRFEQEAKVSASLDHPRIVKIYDFGEAAGECWYSMQLIQGTTLASYVRRLGPLDATQLARLAIPLLDALDYSHGRGVIHRDIKPLNIMINQEGRPYLTDFGIAKTTDSLHRTVTGQMLGTPAYVAPEQALGQPVDARTDLYSLGITLYEMCARRLPFTAENAIHTLVMRIHEDPEPLSGHRPDLPPELVEVIMRALSREPGQRPQSAQSMRNEFIAVADRAQLTWNAPLSFDKDRLPLEPSSGSLTEPLNERLPPATFQATRAISTPKRRKPLWLLAGALVLSALGTWVWKSRAPSPPLTHTVTPTAQSTPGVSQGPAALPAAAAPGPQKPTPTLPLPKPAVRDANPESVRRPVTLPHPEDTPPALSAHLGTACKGLSIPFSARIGEDGQVKSCHALTTAPVDCIQAAQSAVLRWRFKPALDSQGRPVESTISIAVPIVEAP